MTELVDSALQMGVALPMIFPSRRIRFNTSPTGSRKNVHLARASHPALPQARIRSGTGNRVASHCVARKSLL